MGNCVAGRKPMCAGNVSSILLDNIGVRVWRLVSHFLAAHPSSEGFFDILVLGGLGETQKGYLRPSFRGFAQCPILSTNCQV